MTPFSFPSPAEGVWHLGPVPLRAYALCIIAGIVLAVWLGERRWVARGGRAGDVTEIATWMVPFGDHRRPDLPRPHLAGRVLRRRRHPAARALHLEGRPRHLGRHRARRRRRLDRLPPARHPAAGLRRRARARHRARPGRRPAGQLLQPGAVRQAHRPAVGGGDRRRTPARPATPTRRPTTRRSSTSCCGTSASPRSSSGPTAASGSATAGRSRCTSRRTPSGAAGSRRCASTRPHDVLGLRLNDWTSLLVLIGAVVYLVVSARLRPGRETPEELEALRRPRRAETVRTAGRSGRPAGADDDRPTATTEPTRETPMTTPDARGRPRRADPGARPSARRCASSTSTPTSPAAGCGPLCSAPRTGWCPTSP